MKVILQKAVKKLGEKGDVVDVADGYGRNYLIPNGLASKASSGNISQLKHKKKIEKKKNKEKIEEARKKASKLEEKTFEVTVKAGENGRLFGSVTAMDIADKVEEAGFEIDKRKIDLDDHIKSLGVHKVQVKLYENVEATLKVKVVEAN